MADDPSISLDLLALLAKFDANTCDSTFASPLFTTWNIGLSGSSNVDSFQHWAHDTSVAKCRVIQRRKSVVVHYSDVGTVF